jgi:hypothetical protein
VRGDQSGLVSLANLCPTTHQELTNTYHSTKNAHRPLTAPPIVFLAPTFISETIYNEALISLLLDEPVETTKKK